MQFPGQLIFALIFGGGVPKLTFSFPTHNCPGNFFQRLNAESIRKRLEREPFDVCAADGRTQRE